MRSRLRSYRRFFSRLRAFLNQPLSEELARSVIRRRFEEREARFLRLVQRAVFACPQSPYLPLLRAAGCSYADLESELRHRDLFDVLRRLRDAGVHVTLDEFKGRAPIERGGAVTRPSAQDFDSPLIEADLEFSTAGSSGGPTRMMFDLDFMAERACYEHLVFRMLDVYGVPLSLWYPELPASTGIGNCLRYAKIGHPPARWFSMRVGAQSSSAGAALATRLAVATSRNTAAPLPWPRRLGHEQSEVVVDWIRSTQARHGRCAVQSYVSTAVRICQSAREQGVDLSGTRFIVGSEPLSLAKRREIDAAGAMVYARYYATEPGTIGLGCGEPQRPDEPSDFHLAGDTIAAIPGEAPAAGDSRRPLLLTSLLESGPKVMINVDLGDVGTLRERRCGCLLSEAGFTTHIADIASAQRATAEGMALPYDDLKRIAEEVLPKRYGGTSLDYQWLEGEDERGLTRVRLRVSPRLGGGVDLDGLRDFVFEQLVEIDRRNRFFVEIWRRAGTLRVARELPTRTELGKLHPVLRIRAGADAPPVS